MVLELRFFSSESNHQGFMQGSDRIKTEFVVTFVSVSYGIQRCWGLVRGGHGWTLMGLVHGLNSGDWLGDLSEPDMGAMVVCALWVECAGLGVWV